MTYTPVVNPVEVARQGGEVFIRQAGWIDARVLGTAGSAESHTIPTGAKFVVFSADGPFYANCNATATIPTDEVTDGSASVYSPNQMYIAGKTAISLITPDAGTIVTMSFYAN